MCRKPIFLISFILLAALVNSAATQTWTNASGDRKWNNPSNWIPPTVPGGPALINPPPLEGPVVNCNVNVLNIDGPKHNSSSDQVMIVIADGNTINVIEDWRVANQGSGVGTLLIGGTPTINIGGDFRCADDEGFTTAIVDISGNPTINIDGQWRNADQGGFIDIDISGGIINVEQEFRIGDDGSGIIDVYGGTINVDDDWILICRPLTSWAAFGMYGGQVNIAGDLIMVQDYGAGMAFLDMDAGTINIGDDLELPGGNGTGILSMTGGNINVAGYFRLGTAGTGQVYLCGGTIKTHRFRMGPRGTMGICCFGKLIVDDPNGSVKATIDGYVANGWITCIDSYCSEVMVAWNGTTTTVSCQPLGRKWSQPPIEVNPDSEIPNYCGWHEDSYTDDPCAGWDIVADDFHCLGSMPITAIHWWGSYDDWFRYAPPEHTPVAWRIGFWSNVPADDPCNPEDFSYPKELLWQIEAPAERVQSKWVGKDELGSEEKCFRYYVKLEPNEWFWQDQFLADTNDDIYWLSIAAIYDPCEGQPAHEWGCKTRPWSWMDDAVRFEVLGNPQPGMVLDPCDNYIVPLEYEGESFDVAFELVTDPNYIKHEQPFTGIREWPHYEDELSMMAREPVTVPTKWAQPPCLADPFLCMDVDATHDTMPLPPYHPPQALADDFFCTATGLITDIRIWASWLDDDSPYGDPNDAVFTLCIYSNDPVGPNGWSVPNGPPLWTKMFQQGQFTVERYSEGPQAYYIPCEGLYWPNNHWTCWLYSFYIDPCEAFVQQEGTIYWLAVQAHVDDKRLGWKNSTEQWNDDAVWAQGILPGSLGGWNELLHPETDESVDLAFEIETTEQMPGGAAPGVRAEAAQPAGRAGTALDLSVSTQQDRSGAVSMEVTVPELGPARVRTLLDGQVVNVGELPQGGSPGDPLLPYALVRLLVPPDADMETVKAELVSGDWEELPGEYEIAPAPPAAVSDGENPMVSWGAKDESLIINGRDSTIYGKDSYFPTEPVQMVCVGQFRQWKLVEFKVWMAAYNPVRKKVSVLRNAIAALSVQPLPANLAIGLSSPTPPVLPGAAKFASELLAGVANPQDLEGFYGTLEGAPLLVPADYVIITTSTIVSNSTKLTTSFIADKQAQGFTVKTVTEAAAADDTHYVQGATADGRADNIRSWLKAYWAGDGIEYVLLIGDPDPCEPRFDPTISIPMKWCWPRSTIVGAKLDERRCPSDMFFADLSGNWDIDANGLYGEFYNDYQIPGGADKFCEVKVGRIPVYDSNCADLDAILQKCIDYRNAGGDLTWRGKLLIPAAVSNFAPQDDTGNGVAEAKYNVPSERTFGDGWGQAIKSLASSYAYSPYTLYETFGVYANGSAYPLTACNAALNNINVINEWKNYYGFVTWWAHGSQTSASRFCWTSDATFVNIMGNCFPHYEASWYTLVSTADCASLDANHPSFVVQASCDNAYPENSGNLAYSLLKRGAIGTIAGTRATWYKIGAWLISDGGTFGDNASYGYYCFDRMAGSNDTVGEALVYCKSNFGTGFTSGASWMNMVGLTLYGDPALAIGIEPGVKWEQPPDETEDGIDVRCDRNDGIQRTLADDFLCTTNGPITKVILWGSWLDDVKGEIEKIHLSIHSDDPCGPGGWSEPNELLWEKDFYAPDIYETLYRDGEHEEWWWDPATGELIQWCDRMIWQYEISIDRSEAFTQEGDPCNPVVYWLDVYVEIDPCDPNTEFGWKTSTEHWNDDAVWSDDDGNDPNELRYPSGYGHPFDGNSIDLAFAIITLEEPLVIRRLVADDWPCDQNTPITAAAWWGSYIGYRYEACQEQLMVPPVKPDYFWLTIWDDVPAGTGLAKWIQEPDLDTTGMDVLAGPRMPVFNTLVWHETFLADDFLCTESGQITDIHIWASYNEDIRLMEQPLFSLVIYDNVPAGTGGIPYSRPGQPLWDRYVQPTAEQIYAADVNESFYDPNRDEIIGWDTQVWRFDFEFEPNDPNDLFFQEEGQIYWLGLHHTFDLDGDGLVNLIDVFALKSAWPGCFGWKTSLDHFEDDAVWTEVDTWGLAPHVVPPSGQIWNELRYPLNHPLEFESIDLAFEINTGEGLSYSHPKDNIWEYNAYDYDEVLVGYDKHPEGGHRGPNEPVFRYSVRIPQEDWFCQEKPNSVYWFSAVAVYDENTPNYDWGWTNHEHVYNDDAVAGYVDANGAWVWEELYDQNGVSVDMSFILFTEPGCFPCTHPDYFEWLYVGKPNCWCYPRQCHGDADGLPSGKKNYWVATPDLTIMKSAWGKPLGLLVGNEICADFDHLPSGKKFYRVATPDLIIMKANWGIPNGPDPNCFTSY